MYPSKFAAVSPFPQEWWDMKTDVNWSFVPLSFRRPKPTEVCVLCEGTQLSVALGNWNSLHIPVAKPCAHGAKIEPWRTLSNLYKSLADKVRSKSSLILKFYRGQCRAPKGGLGPCTHLWAPGLWTRAPPSAEVPPWLSLGKCSGINKHCDLHNVLVP